jgi:hypothetical protein
MVGGPGGRFTLRAVPGARIIRTSWIANLVFALSAVPFALGVGALEALAVGAALALFAASLVVWVWAFGTAVVRSSRGDDIAVGNLFLLEGEVAPGVRRQLFSSVGVCLVVTAATASADPFGVLVPMLPVGLVGLWGAKHGVFGIRPGFEPEVRPLRPERRSGGRGGHGVRSPKRPETEG